MLQEERKSVTFCDSCLPEMRQMISAQPLLARGEGALRQHREGA
jgi:hypothetical protein